MPKQGRRTVTDLYAQNPDPPAGNHANSEGGHAAAPPIARRLGRLVEVLPDGSAVLLGVDTIRSWLDETAAPAVVDTAPSTTALPANWKVWLWTVPDETRIGSAELLEAISKSPSWLYKQTSAAPADRTIPFRKLGNDLVFVVAEIREWIGMTEIVEVPLDLVRLRLGYRD